MDTTPTECSASNLSSTTILEPHIVAPPCYTLDTKMAKFMQLGTRIKMPDGETAILIRETQYEKIKKLMDEIQEELHIFKGFEPLLREKDDLIMKLCIRIFQEKRRVRALRRLHSPPKNSATT